MRVARSTNAHTDTGHYKTLQQHHQSCRRCRSIWPQFVADTTRVDTPRAPAAVRSAAVPIAAGLDNAPEVDLAGRASITVVGWSTDWAPSSAAAAVRRSATLTDSLYTAEPVHTQGDLAVIRLILYNCRRAVLNAVIFGARCRDRSTKLILRLSKTTSYCHSDRPQRTLDTC